LSIAENGNHVQNKFKDGFFTQGGRVTQFHTTLRLRYLNALALAKEKGASEELVLPRQTRYGGARVRGLYVHSFRYCKAQLEKRTGHLYYNYRRPCESDREVVSGMRAFSLLQNVMGDNMYGQHYMTGFLLLYEVLIIYIYIFRMKAML
tara:strand:+ start:209 stop:655 length:447 start_codon:yes stop_codon:yes gene_type:complete